MAPFLLVGFGIGFLNLNEPEYRSTLALALLSPLGAALVGVGITRVLIFVLPVGILTTVGLSTLVTRLEARRFRAMWAWLLFSLLTFFNAYLLYDALTEGPTWFQDYGLGGMQYGGRQVFGEAEALMEEDQQRTVYVSSTWANGTDILMRFFIPDGSPVFIGNADGFLDQEMDLNRDMIFILTAEEFKALVESPKISAIDILDTISLPNGEPGFYVTTFAYSIKAKQIFAQEQEERTIPREGNTEWEGQTIEVNYPHLDMGELHHIFDDDLFTLARVHSANPAMFTITFERPTTLEGLQLTTGSMDLHLRASVLLESDPEPLVFEETYTDLPDDPTVKLPFGEALEDVIEFRLEIESLTPGDPFKIHVRELSWYPPGG
jgi:hypothetical protein